MVHARVSDRELVISILGYDRRVPLPEHVQSPFTVCVDVLGG